MQCILVRLGTHGTGRRKKALGRVAKVTPKSSYRVLRSLRQSESYSEQPSVEVLKLSHKNVHIITDEEHRS